MPTPVKSFVIVCVGIGLGTITWGIGGLMDWNKPLLQGANIIFMDSQGAIGIGVGALAGAVTAIVLFRSTAPSQVLGKQPMGRDDLR
jgi:uncharacterized membrane protein